MEKETVCFNYLMRHVYRNRNIIYDCSAFFEIVEIINNQYNYQYFTPCK